MAKTYEEVMTLAEEVEQQIDELENTEEVRKYLKLLEKKVKLHKLENELYCQSMIDKYTKCKHMIIEVIREDGIENKEGYVGCIKCGLDESIFAKRDEFVGTEGFTDDEKIMYKLLTEGHLDQQLYRGIFTGVQGSLSDAMKLYSSLKEKYPVASDLFLERKFYEEALGASKSHNM